MSVFPNKQEQIKQYEDMKKAMSIGGYASVGGVGGLVPYPGTVSNGVYNPQPTRAEIGVKELTIRSMENGYIVTSENGPPNYHTKNYVATDIDDLCETIKLALVNRKLDAIK